MQLSLQQKHSALFHYPFLPLYRRSLSSSASFKRILFFRFNWDGGERNFNFVLVLLLKVSFVYALHFRTATDFPLVFCTHTPEFTDIYRKVHRFARLGGTVDWYRLCVRLEERWWSLWSSFWATVRGDVYWGVWLFIRLVRSKIWFLKTCESSRKILRFLQLLISVDGATLLTNAFPRN